ncbi:MAG TPA: tetratricopeptide repeat protein, partial [Longimicrobiaceae bacterium]|nr:tetratricopeptide repeat protein [Longimicrobiaceae bacterium]
MSDETSSSERRSRKWRIPPAVRSNRESISGQKILEEVANDLGIMLWQAYRDVELWADTEPEERGELFQPVAFDRIMQRLALISAPPVVIEQLSIIADGTRTERAADPLVLSAACLSISDWATAEGYSWAAVSFAQAGALAAPESAAAAYEVGRAARRAADYSKAESWYQRSIALARRSGEWETYALAQAGIGSTFFQRGAIPPARRALFRALRTARKHRIWSVRGVALHYLFAIAANGR